MDIIFAVKVEAEILEATEAIMSPAPDARVEGHLGQTIFVLPFRSYRQYGEY
jgi:hypothetical protein